MDDDQRTLRECDIATAETTSLIVARYIRTGKTALVTCHMGLNRSGLICALTLHVLHGWSGVECVKHVRAHRPGSLFNPAFAAYVEALR